MLNICLTFDYELFLGKNFLSSEEILFNPTNEIMRVLKSEQIRGTFFADVCSVLQHERYKEYDYSQKFTEQLQTMAILKQDVQLHIHSNWLLSSPVYEGKKTEWNISEKGYRIHEFDENSKYEDTIDSIIKKGKEYLQNTLSVVYPDYKCIAFRAGGFSVQPEEKLFRILLDNGIFIDSSVAPKLESEYYNFHDVPLLSSWWINPKNGIEKESLDPTGCIYEVSIATIRNNIFRFAKIPIKEWHINGSTEKGRCMGEVRNAKKDTLADVLKLISRRCFGYSILSLDSRGYKILIQDLTYLYKRWECEKKEAMICIICHPKLASYSTLENMKNFIQEVNKRKEYFRFVTLRDIYDNIIKNN